MEDCPRVGLGNSMMSSTSVQTSIPRRDRISCGRTRKPYRSRYLAGGNSRE
jgi:hypothetical protein